MTDIGFSVPDHRVGLSVKSANARKRHRTDLIMTVVLTGLVGVALFPLVMILFVVVREGAAAMNLEFLTEPTPFSFRDPGGGFFNGLVGTSYMLAIAIVLSVPVGIFAAVFLVEFKHSRLAPWVRFFTDVMTGVPSVFVGLFVYAILVRGRLGFGTLVGAVALSILMLPIVVRSAEEILKLVPAELRNGSYALGARHWQTVVRVVLPAAAPGLVTGVMLAVARAAGETAPLLLTALGALTTVTALQGGNGQAALPLQIFDGARNPFAAGQERAWAGALELMLLVLLLTIVARWLGSRATKDVRR